MATFTGRFVTAQIAKAEMTKYLYIRSKTHYSANNQVKAAIDNVIAQEPDQAAKDAMKNYFESEVTSFIFDRQIIDALWQLTQNGPTNGIRVCLAARPENDPDVRVTPGSPTLIIMPVHIEFDGEEISNVTDKPFNDATAALEYPGGIVDPVVPPTGQMQWPRITPGMDIRNTPI